MRRFEFAEGGSSKFWQIVLDGVRFTVNYGKMGTSGQSQTKEFASADKAEKEHDKLVAEKVKKGYVEVDAGTATLAPAPAKAAPKVTAPAVAKATPVPAAPKAVAMSSAAVAAPIGAPAVVPEPGEEPIVWSDALLNDDHDEYRNVQEGVVPHFGGPAPKDFAMPTPAEAFAALKADWVDRHVSKFWKRKAAPDLQSSLDLAFAWIEADAPGPLEVEVQAIVSAIFGFRFGGNQPSHRGLIALWWQLGGPAFTVRAMEAITHFCTMSFDNIASTSYRGMVMERQKRDHEARSSTGAWNQLGRLLAAGDATAYAQARAAAAELWSVAPHGPRWDLLTAFPTETEWADEQAQDWLDNIDVWMKVRYIFPNFQVKYSLDVLEQVAKRFAKDGMNPNVASIGGASWLWFYGTDALPMLVWGLEKSAWRAHREHLVDLIGAVQGARSAKALAGYLLDRELKQRVATWLTEHPALAVPALAALVAGRGKLSDPAGMLLAQLDRSEPALVDALLPTLSGAARGAVETLRERLRVPPEATPAELPGVLADPPWRKKSKKPAPTVVTGLLLPDRAEAIHWGKGEQARTLKTIDAWRKAGHGKGETLATMRAQEGYYASSVLYRMGALSDEEALEGWNTLPSDRFRYCTDLVAHPLARHGLAAISGYVRYASIASVAAAEFLLRVDSLQLAPLYARGFGGKALRKHAEAWLTRYPETAALGIIPIAVGPAGKERQTAEAALRWLVTRGKHEEAVRAAARHYGAAAESAVAEVLAFDPRELLPKKTPKLPEFWDASTFMRPLLKGRERALPLAAVDALGEMLAFSPADSPYAGLDDVREACDPSSLEDFAWSLFNAWNMAGASSKEGWAFQTLALFGGDDVARRLTPLIREWPGQSAQARAVAGLDILARIGSDVALMHLNGIALKLRFKALQEKAREKIDEIAADRGLTAEELADRLVPDLDLDDDGSRVLDFGARQFRVGFDEELKPFVLDDSGKKLSDLPKPNKSDDAAKAKEAVDAWKVLKKDVKTLGAQQITRLELAMCRQRRWQADGFKVFLVDHPLLVHVVRRLVWGVYADGRVASTFRVAEDRTLADAEDAPFTLSATAQVGVVHPLELDAPTAAAWGQVLGDYGILQPFPQIGRDTYAPTNEEQGSTELRRVFGAKIPSGRLLGLDLKGWRKGPPQDSGGIWTYDKPLGNSVVVELGLEPGLAAEMAYTDPEQKLHVATLTWDKEEHTKMTYAALDPIVFSELVRDLVGLRG